MKAIIGIITALFTMWVIDNSGWIVKLPVPASIFLILGGVISGSIMVMIFCIEVERLWE